jgi:hypothetical protein
MTPGHSLVDPLPLMRLHWRRVTITMARKHAPPRLGQLRQFSACFVRVHGVLESRMKLTFTPIMLCSLLVSRDGAAYVQDNNGRFYMYGGAGYGSPSSNNYDDLWSASYCRINQCMKPGHFAHGFLRVHLRYPSRRYYNQPTSQWCLLFGNGGPTPTQVGYNLGTSYGTFRGFPLVSSVFPPSKYLSSAAMDTLANRIYFFGQISFGRA